MVQCESPSWFANRLPGSVQQKPQPRPVAKKTNHPASKLLRPDDMVPASARSSTRSDVGVRLAFFTPEKSVSVRRKEFLASLRASPPETRRKSTCALSSA